MKRINLLAVCGIALLVAGVILFALDAHRYATWWDWLGWPLLWLAGGVLLTASMLRSIFTAGRRADLEGTGEERRLKRVA